MKRLALIGFQKKTMPFCKERIFRIGVNKEILNFEMKKSK